MSTSKMSAGCAVCADFAVKCGAVVRRLWEIEHGEVLRITKRFLLQDNASWLKLLHQAWVAHQIEDHQASALRLRPVACCSSVAL